MKQDKELILSRKKVVSGLNSPKVSLLMGDASSRRYYRLFDKESSYIAAITEDRPQLERFFYITEVFACNMVNVPKILDYDFEKGIIVQEDLGDQSFVLSLSEVNNWNEDSSFYEQAIVHLIKINSINPQAKEKYPVFDLKKLTEETNLTIEYFIKEMLGADQRDVEFFEKFYYELNNKISQMNKVLCHRDYHSRNIMMKQNQQYVIDYQDARLGPAEYDLVSLLEDSYTSIEKSVKDKLKKYYFNEASKSDVIKYSYDDFSLNYKTVATQRIFKALGSFATLYYKHKKDRYLKYIGKSVESLRNLYLDSSLSREEEKYLNKLLRIFYAN